MIVQIGRGLSLERLEEVRGVVTSLGVVGIRRSITNIELFVHVVGVGSDGRNRRRLDGVTTTDTDDGEDTAVNSNRRMERNRLRLKEGGVGLILTVIVLVA